MKKNILIVDDDQRLRELLKDYLSEKNLDVYVCDDFKNAKEIIEFLFFDLIILDRMMPSGDGIDLISFIKKLSNTPVIMLTAMGEDINKIATRIYKDNGYFEFVRHRIGHGMGFEGHEAPWLSPGDKTVLKKNMIFSNEPGIYRPNIDGYRTISSMIVETNNGRQISKFLDKSIDNRIINLN